jgi:dimeric dUTPase (all-alpha-NTP-PPase superfamily)
MITFAPDFEKTQIMRRINTYKKMFNVEGAIDLKELKTTYRGLVKKWHPDKFQDNDSQKAEAEVKSQEIIDGYHFLVSISPETKEADLEVYKTRTTLTGIADFQFKKQVLEVTFLDGAVYEYFGVSPKVFQKMVNTDKLMRFSKRNIFNSYLYRQSKKATVKAAEPEMA